MLDGHIHYRSGTTIGIPEHIAKTMKGMFDKWRAGDAITVNPHARGNCPKVATAYALLLAGATDAELRDKCTALEIEKAKLFAQIAHTDRLFSTFSRTWDCQKVLLKF